MFKPIIIEAFVIIAAGIGYLAEGTHGLAKVTPNLSVNEPVRLATASVEANAIRTNEKFSADLVKMAEPAQQIVADTIPITGQLTLDKQQMRTAFSYVGGRVSRIFVFEGQSVKAGDTLAEIYSAEYISAQREFLLAKSAKDASDAKPLVNVEASYRSAANKLKLMGASAQDVVQLAKTGEINESLKVRAPISGVITQRNVEPGGILNAGDPLMSLANLDRLWLLANVDDSDYTALKLGQELSFLTAALPGRTFTAQITFVGFSVDPTTHTFPIRCTVQNSQFLLRPEMLIQGALKIGERSAWVLPKSAVIHSRGFDYVFVKSDDKIYRRVAVRGHLLGADNYVVTSGIAEALPIVSDGGSLSNKLVKKD
jgi:Cu(I)/Ag(I) efflux system membrane fusion protein